MTWYEITDEISYLPGGLAKSEVTYKAGFYDLEYGLQTHVFAPAGVEIKGLWKVGGNAPGEPPETRELGVETPKAGLYLREDVELRCNFFLTSFVKKNLKGSHAKLVEEMIAKAGDPKYSEGVNRLPEARSDDVSKATSQTPQYAPSPEEPCSCAAGRHEVMCPNYRYVRSTSSPNSSPRRSRHTPIEFVDDQASWPSSRQPASASDGYRASTDQHYEAYKNKPLPPGPPRSSARTDDPTFRHAGE